MLACPVKLSEARQIAVSPEARFMKEPRAIQCGGESKNA
jgi:hypothetical protein